MNKTNNNMILLSDTGRDCITFMDGITGNVIRNIHVSANSGPHGITVCENGQFLCFSNQFDNCINIYDMINDRLGENIGTGATPCHIAKIKEKLYVSNADSDSISVIDMEEKNSIMVIPSGRMPHDVIEWKNCIIAAESGSDSIGMIDSSNDEYVQRIDLKCSPIHICRLPGKNMIAAACTEYGIEVKGYICIIDMVSLNLIEKIRVGNCLTDIVSDKEGNYVYVSDGGKGSVYKVDMSTGLVVSDIFLSGYLSSLSFDEHTEKLIVTEGMKDRIYVIDGEKGIVERIINTGRDISHTAFI